MLNFYDIQSVTTHILWHFVRLCAQPLGCCERVDYSPMMAVGLMEATASSRLLTGAWSWANLSF